MGILKCGASQYQRDCNARKSTGKQSSGKRKQSKPWSKSEDKGKSKDNKGKSKEKSKGTKCAKVLHKGETSKKGLSGLEMKTRNQRQVRKLRTLHRRVPLTIIGVMTKWSYDEWSYDGWNDDWSSVGWHEGCEQTCHNSASSFSCGS